jgi:hypothetical protein
VFLFWQALTQVGVVKTPAEHLEFPVKTYSLLQVNLQEAPSFKEAPQLPRLPFTGAVITLQGTWQLPSSMVARTT